MCQQENLKKTLSLQQIFTLLAPKGVPFYRKNYLIFRNKTCLPKEEITMVPGDLFYYLRGSGFELTTFCSLYHKLAHW